MVDSFHRVQEPSRRHLELELVRYSHLLHSRDWVANHDGNMSCRLANDRFLVTPTGVSKAMVEREGLLVVDSRGERISGRKKAFSELSLHLFIYRQRPDVRAVLHAHPPTATGFAVAGISVLSTMMAEPIVSLGDAIPLVPYAAPKSPQATLNMMTGVAGADVLLLQNHGVMSYGPDLETAYLRMELVEHLAKIQLVAHQVGGLTVLPEEEIARQLEARAKAGLVPLQIS